jgi:hypothetical protein
VADGQQGLLWCSPGTALGLLPAGSTPLWRQLHLPQWLLLMPLGKQPVVQLCLLPVKALILHVQQQGA